MCFGMFCSLLCAVNGSTAIFARVRNTLKNDPKSAHRRHTIYPASAQICSRSELGRHQAPEAPRRRYKMTIWAVLSADKPTLGRNGSPSWGPRRPKIGQEGLRRRRGSDRELTLYKIHVSINVQTPGSTTYSLEHRPTMCIFIEF